MSQTTNWVTQIKKITNSSYLDFIGVALVLIVSLLLNYHNTKYSFTWNKINYIFPLGYVSIISTCFSMTATRFVTKKNNLGNLIHTFNTMVAGTIDFLLGNLGALLTYPVSFFGNLFAYRIWKKKQYLNSIDAVFYKNMALGMVLSLVLNYLGFTVFSSENINWQLFFAIAIPAGISFGGTFNIGRMYPDNWFTWQFYNLAKIIQNIMLLNYANTAKYIFYLVNACLGYISWRDDKQLQDQNKAVA